MLVFMVNILIQHFQKIFQTITCSFRCVCPRPTKPVRWKLKIMFSKFATPEAREELRSLAARLVLQESPLQSLDIHPTCQAFSSLTIAVLAEPTKSGKKVMIPWCTPSEAQRFFQLGGCSWGVPTNGFGVAAIQLHLPPARCRVKASHHVSTVLLTCELSPGNKSEGTESQCDKNRRCSWCNMTKQKWIWGSAATRSVDQTVLPSNIALQDFAWWPLAPCWKTVGRQKTGKKNIWSYPHSCQHDNLRFVGTSYYPSSSALAHYPIVPEPEIFEHLLGGLLGGSSQWM